MYIFRLRGEHKAWSRVKRTLVLAFTRAAQLRAVQAVATQPPATPKQASAALYEIISQLLVRPLLVILSCCSFLGRCVCFKLYMFAYVFTF